MEIKYSVSLHPAVVAHDIPRLDTFWRHEIRDSIRAKLRTRPEIYGKPLQESLKGCRTLRVGDYRVVFKIQGTIIRVLGIVHRSSGYRLVEKRL